MSVVEEERRRRNPANLSLNRTTNPAESCSGVKSGISDSSNTLNRNVEIQQSCRYRATIDLENRDVLPLSELITNGNRILYREFPDTPSITRRLRWLDIVMDGLAAARFGQTRFGMFRINRNYFGIYDANRSTYGYTIVFEYLTKGTIQLQVRGSLIDDGQSSWFCHSISNRSFRLISCLQWTCIQLVRLQLLSTICLFLYRMYRIFHARLYIHNSRQQIISELDLVIGRLQGLIVATSWSSGSIVSDQERLSIIAQKEHYQQALAEYRTIRSCIETNFFYHLPDFYLRSVGSLLGSVLASTLGANIGTKIGIEIGYRFGSSSDFVAVICEPVGSVIVSYVAAIGGSWFGNLIGGFICRKLINP